MKILKRKDGKVRARILAVLPGKALIEAFWKHRGKEYSNRLFVSAENLEKRYGDHLAQ